MAPRINSPLPQYFQPQFIIPSPRPQASYFPFRQQEIFNPFPRTFDVIPFKKDSLSRVDNILWNPIVDFAHRPLIKQTIYPRTILRDIYRGLQRQEQMYSPFKNLFKRKIEESTSKSEKKQNINESPYIESKTSKNTEIDTELLNKISKKDKIGRM